MVTYLFLLVAISFHLQKKSKKRTARVLPTFMKVRQAPYSFLCWFVWIALDALHPNEHKRYVNRANRTMENFASNYGTNPYDFLFLPCRSSLLKSLPKCSVKRLLKAAFFRELIDTHLQVSVVPCNCSTARSWEISLRTFLYLSFQKK